MKEDTEKISCHICKKIIPKAADLDSVGQEYVFDFCNVECMDYWKKNKESKKKKE